MDFNKRVQDVSQVFDRQWSVNRNTQEKKAFFDNRKVQCLGIDSKTQVKNRRQEILRANSVSGQINRLNEKMQAMDASQRLAKMNDFKNNFR